MSKIVYIKRADTLKWYNVGEKYLVFDIPTIVNGKIKYLVNETQVINYDDCFSDNEIREKKLERITK